MFTVALKNGLKLKRCNSFTLWLTIFAFAAGAFARGSEGHRIAVEAFDKILRKPSDTGTLSLFVHFVATFHQLMQMRAVMVV